MVFICFAKPGVSQLSSIVGGFGRLTEPLCRGLPNVPGRPSLFHLAGSELLTVTEGSNVRGDAVLYDVILFAKGSL